jgi:DNA-binding MarR family transcriptional regulator
MPCYVIGVETTPARAAGPSAIRGALSPAFLLAQVGDMAAAHFADRLAPLGFLPQDAGVLRLIAAAPGINQRTLGERLGIFPSRLVALLDGLEQKGLVERRRVPEDRRNHALHLTAAGGRALQAIGKVAMAHQDDICGSLSVEERAQLGEMLQRIAAAHGLSPGVHPGFRHI